MEQIYQPDNQGRITCPHCGSQWKPRVPRPKFCPFCRRPMQKVSSRRHIEVVKPVSAIRHSEKSLIWCENHQDAATTGERLAMFEYEGHGYCLECMKSVLTSLKQITLADVFNRSEN